MGSGRSIGLSGREPALRDMGLAAAGLACWIVTLILYSDTVTPFQRFAGTSTFVGGLAPRALAIAALVSLAVGTASFTGRHLSHRVLAVAGGACYVGAAIAFGTLCLIGLPTEARWLTWPLAAITAVGSVGTGLAWGRVYKGFSPRGSLACIALASVAAAVLGLAAIAVPAVPYVALFAVEALAAAVLPCLIGMQEPGCEAALTAEGLQERPLAERLRSFTDVAGPALIGLLAFAFVMGTMRQLIIDAYPIHLGVLVVCGVILGALAFGKTRRLRLPASAVYRSLIPTLAVLLLAVTNITAALWEGSALDMVMIFLLYTLAAVLTLSTLAAIAHAGEFPSDLVFASALMLFGFASFAGLKSAEVMSDEAIRVSSTVITTVYALAMVLLGSLRANRADLPDEGADPFAPLPATARRTDGDAVDANDEQERIHRSELERRCAELADAHRLTPREAQILAYLAKGHGSGYIGEALYISPNTVRTHIHNIYRKLGVGSREEILSRVRG